MESIAFTLCKPVRRYEDRAGCSERDVASAGLACDAHADGGSGIIACACSNDYVFADADLSSK